MIERYEGVESEKEECPQSVSLSKWEKQDFYNWIQSNLPFTSDETGYSVIGFRDSWEYAEEITDSDKNYSLQDILMNYKLQYHILYCLRYY